MVKRNSRNANGEGSVYKRGDGRWVAQWTSQDAFHGPKALYAYGKTQKEAIRKRKEKMAEEVRGLVFDAGRVSVGEYLARWLEDAVRHSVKSTTLRSYSGQVRGHLIPALGRGKLKDITVDHVRRYRSLKLEEGCSTRTIQYQLVLLRKALQQAVEDGLVSRNAAQGVTVKQERKNEIRPLTSEQAKRLLAAAEGDRLEPLYILAVHTGLRQGELLALKWEDIDSKSGTLSVNRTLAGTEDGRPVFSTPKTPKSRRSLRLTKRALDALERRKAERCEEGGGGKNPDLVFTSTVGTPLNRHNLSRRSFKPLLRKAGLPGDVRFHDLRHTFATILMSKGTNPKIVSEMLGHSDVGITLNTYSHVLPNMQDRAVDDMDDALS